jgi:HEAT repeat protein
MRFAVAGLLLFLVTVLPITAAPSAEELVGNLKKAAHADARTSQAAKEAVVDAGPEAIPFLLPLLSDDDEQVRILAGWVVSEIKGLSDEHLDILIQAYRRGVLLVGSGIVRIGSPRAVDFVVETLVSDSHPDELLIANAPGLLREKLVPGLVQLYRTDREWDDGVDARIARVFGHLRTNAKSAIGPLLEIANDKTISVKRRVRAIAALSAIGVSFDEEIESLQRLQKDEDDLIRDAALEARAFIAVGNSFERTLQIRDLARQGTLATYAGPDLVKDLEAEDWDVRAAAAGAVGYIGFEEAIDSLVPLLHRDEDWRLVYAAAESLGRLRARKALPALAAVSKEYWYPPAREAAKRAMASIRDSAVPQSESSEETIYDNDFFDRGRTDSDWINEKEARSLRFPVAVTPDDLVSIPVRVRGRRDEEKMRGVKVEDGYLVGSDRGEWGGEIVYVNHAGKARILMPVNTEAIYRTKAGFLAVSGVAHMTFNSGCVFRISKTTEGEWSASNWRVLPGAPRVSRLLKDGNLFISCQGGMVLISPDGRMRSVTRQESGFKTQEPAKVILEDIP